MGLVENYSDFEKYTLTGCFNPCYSGNGFGSMGAGARALYNGIRFNPCYSGNGFGRLAAPA